METVNPFVGVIGPSFSGKSTLINNLSMWAQGKVTTVFEMCEYAGGNHNFRRIPFQSAIDAQENIHDFIEWEKRRCQDARRLYEKTGLPVVIDRTIYCVLLTQLLIKEFQPEWFNSFEYAIEEISSAVDASQIFIPSRLILMNSSSEDVFQLRSKRGVSVGMFMQPDVRNFLYQKYKVLAMAYLPRSVAYLSSDNGPTSRQDLVTDALRFIGDSQPTEVSLKLLKIWRLQNGQS